MIIVCYCMFDPFDRPWMSGPPMSSLRLNDFLGTVVTDVVPTKINFHIFPPCFIDVSSLPDEWSTTALQSQQTTRLPVGCRWLTTIITIFSIPHIPKDRVPWFIKSCPNSCQSGEFAGGDATRIGLQDRAAMRRHGVTIGRPWRLPRKLVTWWQHAALQCRAAEFLEDAVILPVHTSIS